MKEFDVIIIGGGLAGLTAALHLSQQHLPVLVIEKHRYPRHKVCGEYLSNEVLPYFNQLGVSLPNPVRINKLQLSTAKGNLINTSLPLGGLGISRYALDHTLYLKAISHGVTIKFDTVTAVGFGHNAFKIRTKTGACYNSELVIGAYGKRAALDKNLQRKFLKKRSPWLAVKAHYEFSDFPDELVALHNFKGGYGGLSKTESGVVNFCYLANYKNFAKYKDIAEFEKKVISQNPFLNSFLQAASPIFERPLTIAQFSFEKKQAVEQHMLMCGDAAALIHPLCGNGMAMAIHSAKIAAEMVTKYYKDDVRQRRKLETHYSQEWKQAFSRRLRTANLLQSLLLQPALADNLFKLAVRSPEIIKRIISNTHGQPLTTDGIQ